MRPQTLIGLMFCTLFLSTPVFAQPTTAQPVIQTAQAAQNDVTIPQGTTQVFDASKGEIAFDGVLTNKGTIIIRSSDPAQAEAILRASKVVNEGEIISEVPKLTINTAILGGTGDYRASETISVNNDDALQIRGGRFYSEWFRPKTKGWLVVNANRIDGKVDLAAGEVSIGVREGHLNIVNQKLDGDPLIYNTGGNVTTAIPPSGGEDIMILASGDVLVGSIDATGSSTSTEGKLVIGTGIHFKRDSNGEVIFPCGTGGGTGHDCNNLVGSLSQPGGPLETEIGPFPLAGKIVISGDVKAKIIIMTSREIEINGNIRAVKDGDPAQASVLLFASKSITVTGTIKTDANAADPRYGAVSLDAPVITVNGKITTDSVNLNASETVEATTGSITTGAIEAGMVISMNAGHIIFQEVGGALLPSALPHDSGQFTIKTGKLTAHEAITLAATGNIDAGNIELLPNEAEVPLAEHWVRVHANVGKEDAPPMKIGGGTNGAASITVHGTTDFGPGLTQKTGAIFLTNGPSGDIVLDGAKIHITSEHDGTPSLIASAGTGQITVKGNITFDGTSTAPAGQVLLVGDEIRSTGATISAKDTLAAAAENPAKVILVTSKLTLAGDLTVEANSKAQTSVRVVPKGSVVIDPQEHAVTVSVGKFTVNATEHEVLVAGGGNLTVKAKSDGAKVEITANPLRFNNGTSNIAAEGAESQLNVDYAGAGAQNTLIFSGSTATFDVSNTDGNAGSINIQATRIRSDVGADPKFLATSSNGNGGFISISAERINLGETSNKFDVSSTTAKSGNINVLASGRLDLGSIEANANSGGAEQAGEIHLVGGNNAGTLGSETATVKLSARNIGGTGNGGTIEVAHLNSFTADGANITVGAGTNGNGGIINIHDIGTIKLVGSLRADALGTGKAGSITLEQTSTNAMTLTNVTLSASGGCDQNNDCGIINVSSQGRIQADAATIEAKGFNNAKAGRINIIGNSGVIDLTGTDLNASSSTSGNGEGGFINISNNFEVIVNTAKLLANGSGSGAGGQVRITTGTNQGLLINTVETEISAVGGQTGAGGIVVIPTLTQLGGGQLFLVNTFIHVKSGDGVNDVSTFGGSISLNGTTCQRTLTNHDWPVAYWNCVNPGNSSSVDAHPAFAAFTWIPQSHKGQHGNTSIYVMLDVTHYPKFFGQNLPADAGGFTFSEDTNDIINVTVFENVQFPSGQAAMTLDQLTEAVVHEMGHAIDAKSSFPSVTGTYANSVNRDRDILDAAAGGQPCLANGNGPFNGVIDSITEAQFCNGGTLNNPGGIYTGKTNSQIAAISQPGIFGSNSEIYAQAFAYQDYVRTQGVQTNFPFTATANGLFQKDYYQCVQSIGAAQAGVAYTPTYSCPAAP